MRHPDPILSPAEHRRLIGALALLGSDRAGERDAAAHAASRIVQGKGLDWSQVLRPPSLPPPQQEPPGPPDVKSDLALCGRHAARLSDWETSFIVALSQWRGRLSAAQVRKLAMIADRLRAGGLT